MQISILWFKAVDYCQINKLIISTCEYDLSCGGKMLSRNACADARPVSQGRRIVDTLA